MVAWRDVSLSGVDRKHPLFTIAAGSSIAQTDLSTGEALARFVVYVLPSHVCVAVPVI